MIENPDDWSLDSDSKLALRNTPTQIIIICNFLDSLNVNNISDMQFDMNSRVTCPHIRYKTVVKDIEHLYQLQALIYTYI